MKVGDLVKVKHKYSNNESGIGVILKVEEGFYKKGKRGKEIPPPFDHCLTIFWTHNEITHEPYAYIDLISETSNERRT